MSGIREMIGFVFWVNNIWKELMEVLFNGYNGYFKERIIIMYDFEEENIRNILKRMVEKIGDF